MRVETAHKCDLNTPHILLPTLKFHLFLHHNYIIMWVSCTTKCTPSVMSTRMKDGASAKQVGGEGETWGPLSLHFILPHGQTQPVLDGNLIYSLTLQ